MPAFPDDQDINAAVQKIKYYSALQHFTMDQTRREL
jgi:hypothetical protein